MLREAQTALRRFVLLDDDAEAPRLFADDRIPAARRLMLHRNNVMSSLVAVLVAAYPMTERALGASRFRYLAGRFVVAAPPRQPMLSVYGGGFAGHLAAQPELAALPALPDLARLEWARHEAFFAADDPPLDLAALQAVPASLYSRLEFALASSARLLAVGYPVLAWFDGLAAGNPAPAGAGEAREGELLLVFRQGAHVVQRSLSPGEFALLAALGAGGRLEEAAEAAQEASPEFDLQACLGRCLADGIFTGFTVFTV